MSTKQQLQEALEATTEALDWASGSRDFVPGGGARRGWLRIARPALAKADKALNGK